MSTTYKYDKTKSSVSCDEGNISDQSLSSGRQQCFQDFTLSRESLVLIIPEEVFKNVVGKRENTGLLAFVCFNPLPKRQNFGQDQIESICRCQIKSCYNDDFSRLTE